MVFNSQHLQPLVTNLYESVRKQNLLSQEIGELQNIISYINSVKIEDTIGAAKTASPFRCGVVAVPHEKMSNVDSFLEEIAGHTTKYVHWNTNSKLNQKFLKQYYDLSNECKMMLIDYIRGADFRSVLTKELITPKTTLLQVILINEKMELIYSKPAILYDREVDFTPKYHRKIIKDDTPGIEHKPPHNLFLFSNPQGIKDLTKQGIGVLTELEREISEEIASNNKKIEMDNPALVREFLAGKKQVKKLKLIETNSALASIWKMALNLETDKKFIWLVGIWPDRNSFGWCSDCLMEAIVAIRNDWDTIFPGPIPNPNSNEWEWGCLVHPVGDILSPNEVVRLLNKALIEQGISPIPVEALEISSSLLTDEITDFMAKGELLLSID